VGLNVLSVRNITNAAVIVSPLLLLLLLPPLPLPPNLTSTTATAFTLSNFFIDHIFAIALLVVLPMRTHWKLGRTRVGQPKHSKHGQIRHPRT